MERWDPGWMQVVVTAVASVVAMTASHYRLRAAMAELMGRVSATGDAMQAAHAGLCRQVEAIGLRLDEMERRLADHGLQLARLQVVLGSGREPGPAVLAERLESLTAEVRTLREWRNALLNEAAAGFFRASRQADRE